MAPSRRLILSAAAVSLAGCQSRLPTGESDPTRTPTPDEPTQDVLLSNDRSEPVEATIEFVHDGDTDPVVDLTVQLEPGSDLAWAEATPFQHAGRATASFTSQSTDRMTAEADWPNDEADTHTLYVEIDESGIEATVWVA